MITFDIPDVQAGAPALYCSVMVSQFFDLTEEQYTRLLAQSKDDKAGAAHAFFRAPTQLVGKPAELTGILGAHAEGDPKRYWAHYALQVQSDPEPLDRPNEKWDTLFASFAEIAGEHDIDCQVRWLFPVDSVTLGVSLPIVLGPSEVDGFSQIRGVRLAQTDPIEPEDELYSIVLDHLDDSVSAHVSATFKGRLNSDVIAMAAESARRIVSLAVSPISSARVVES